MKKLLVVLSFFLTSSSLWAADEQFKFDALSVSNLAYSIKTNAAIASTPQEYDRVTSRIEAFVNQVRSLSTNTAINLTPEDRKAISHAMLQMGMCQELIIEKRKTEANKLRRKIKGYNSDTSMVASYGLETSFSEGFDQLKLQQELGQLEIHLKKLLGVGHTLTGLTHFMLLSQ